MRFQLVDRKQLLSDLQVLLKRLEADLLERSQSADVPGVGEALRAEHERASSAQRTAQNFNDWRADAITQTAAAWVLSCVFARFLEDNRLIEPPKISGPQSGVSGQQDKENRLLRARDEHELYFRSHPKLTDREYLLAIFEELAKLPGTKHVFGEHNPIRELPNWLSGDAAGELLRFFQKIDARTGQLVHDFTDSEWDTRFLGDLYQDLSESARKRYALLQTPEFVEEFILDRTLEPAIEEFGLDGGAVSGAEEAVSDQRSAISKTEGGKTEGGKTEGGKTEGGKTEGGKTEGRKTEGRKTEGKAVSRTESTALASSSPADRFKLKADRFKIIDPACGSGHFLLGGFRRILDRWQRVEPGTDVVILAQRALDSIHGVDINPYAVAIARFRLLLAAMKVCGIRRLVDTPDFQFHLACGDSLLHAPLVSGQRVFDWELVAPDDRKLSAVRRQRAKEEAVSNQQSAVSRAKEEAVSDQQSAVSRAKEEAVSDQQSAVSRAKEEAVSDQRSAVSRAKEEAVSNQRSANSRAEEEAVSGQRSAGQRKKLSAISSQRSAGQRRKLIAVC